MRNPTNPTGYSLGTPASRPADPDFGPLFSRPASTPHDATTPRPERCAVASLREPSSSHPKAVDIAAKIASERYRRILRSIANNGPSALFELCARFDVTPNQISGRLTELKRMLLLAVVGQKPHPKSQAACEVLDLTDAGRQALKEGKPL